MVYNERAFGSLLTSKSGEKILTDFFGTLKNARKSAKNGE